MSLSETPGQCAVARSKSDARRFGLSEPGEGDAPGCCNCAHRADRAPGRGRTPRAPRRTDPRRETSFRSQPPRSRRTARDCAPAPERPKLSRPAARGPTELWDAPLGGALDRLGPQRATVIHTCVRAMLRMVSATATPRPHPYANEPRPGRRGKCEQRQVHAAVRGQVGGREQRRAGNQQASPISAHRACRHAATPGPRPRSNPESPATREARGDRDRP